MIIAVDLVKTSVLTLALGGLLSSTAGCAVFWLGAGAAGGVAGAAYVRGKLQTEVEASVPRAKQAAIGSLQELGLPIGEQKGDQLSAQVKSKTADDKTIWIDIESVSESRSKISIRVGLMGDESRSRRILDGIQQRL